MPFAGTINGLTDLSDGKLVFDWSALDGRVGSFSFWAQQNNPFEAVRNRLGGSELLIGGPDADTLTGDAGEDTLQGGAGADDHLGVGGYDMSPTPRPAASRSTLTAASAGPARRAATGAGPSRSRAAPPSPTS